MEPQSFQSSTYSPKPSKPAGLIDFGLYPKQMQAFQTRATELLFGGASEGGKSFFVRIALIIWCATIPGLQCFIFRKYFRDVTKNHMQGAFGFKTLLKPWVVLKLAKCTDRQVRFWNGSVIELSGMLYEDDFEKNQGIEKHVMVIDEATQIKGRYVDGLRGWVRMPKEMRELLPEQLAGLYGHIPAEQRADLFPRIIYTANPIGISVGYFRRLFVKARPEGAIEKVGAFYRQYIQSLVTDNKSADPEAQKERLSSLGEAISRALVGGDWDAPIGDFFKEYDETRHVVPDCLPPDYWLKFRSFDWGSAEPFAVYWVAVSDGKSFIDHAGRERWFPRGALLVYREWYGCNPDKPEKGVGMTNEEIAKGIVSRTFETTTGITLTDSFPFQDRGGWKIAQIFAENGCPLTLGDTSRVSGWSQVRDRLIGKEFEKGVFEPMIFFCECCQYARDYIPALETKPDNQEDAVEDGEATHAPDAIRLACKAWPFIRDQPATEQRPSFARADKSPTAKSILKTLKSSKRGRR